MSVLVLFTNLTVFGFQGFVNFVLFALFVGSLKMQFTFTYFVTFLLLTF